MVKKNKETTLRDILDILLPKIWVMLLVGVLLAAMIIGYSVIFKKDTYTSSSLVYVFNDKSSPTASDLQAAEEMVNVYKIVITGGRFLLKICQDEDLASYELTPAEVERMLTISQVDDTGVFKISVTSTNRDLANTVATVITDGIAEHIQGEYGIIKNALQSSVIEDSELATNANSKNIVRNAIIAFLAGFLVAALAVWIHSAFDVVIRSTKKIEDSLDIPVLGVIPRHEINNGGGV